MHRALQFKTYIALSYQPTGLSSEVTTKLPTRHHQANERLVVMAILLTKGQPVSLQKRNSGIMLLTASWDQGSARGVDIDLVCIYETDEGEKGTVQGLGNEFGRLGKAPYVLLHNDERNAGSEVMEVNLARIHQLRRLMFFVYAYSGASTLAKVKNARVTIQHPDYAEPIVVELGTVKTRSCTLVEITVDPVTGVQQLIEVVRHIEGTHRAVDRAFGWNINWRQASK